MSQQLVALEETLQVSLFRGKEGPHIRSLSRCGPFRRWFGREPRMGCRLWDDEGACRCLFMLARLVETLQSSPHYNCGEITFIPITASTQSVAGEWDWKFMAIWSERVAFESERDGIACEISLGLLGLIDCRRARIEIGEERREKRRGWERRRWDGREDKCRKSCWVELKINFKWKERLRPPRNKQIT